MIRVQAYDRRFWLLQQPQGVLRLLGVVAVAVLLVTLGIFFYQNAFTTGIFTVCSAIIAWWLVQKPKQITLTLDNDALHFGTRPVRLQEIDSWSLIDLEEKALLIFRLKSAGFVEIYAEKEELTDSGLVNQLTQKVPFNPDLESSNVLFSVLRFLKLY